MTEMKHQLSDLVRRGSPPTTKRGGARSFSACKKPKRHDSLVLHIPRHLHVRYIAQDHAHLRSCTPEIMHTWTEATGISLPPANGVALRQVRQINDVSIKWSRTRDKIQATAGVDGFDACEMFDDTVISLYFDFLPLHY